MFGKKAKKDFLIFILISLFCILFIYISYFSFKSNTLRIIGTYIDDILLYRYTYFMEGYTLKNNDIIIIKIDEKTLNTLQKSDLKILTASKEIYSQFIEKVINDYKANIVGIDIVFANKSTLGEKDEQILANTLEKYKDKVVIATRGDNKDVPLCTYNNVQHGATEWIFQDNIIRSFKIKYDDYLINDNCSNNYFEGNNIIYSFVIEVYKKYISINKIRENKYMSTFDKYINNEISTGNNVFYSRFFHNKENNGDTIGFKSYSLIDILNGEDINLKNKIVLLGEVGTLFHDKNVSPISFNREMSGVEFHANGIATLLQGIYHETGAKDGLFPLLHKINTKYIIIILIITTLLLNYIVIKFSTYFSLFFTFILFLIHVIVGIELFIQIGYIYPIFFFIYTLLVTYIISYFYKYFSVNKQKKYIKKSFGLFVDPEIVNIISEDPGKLKLKGKKDYLTLFFSDIANFTEISEKMQAEKLFTFLNEYFNLMTKILTKNKGTLDKYIGDSVMGFFNAPLKIDYPEFMACKTAIEQQKAIKILNIKWSKIINQNLNVRIGIHSGEAIHGNLGSKDNRINYTVIGDNVNLASRLEGINKIYGTNIIISYSVYKAIKEDFVTRELDTITVKGKSQKTKIFELISPKNKNVIDRNILKNYKNGLKFYYEANYEKAIIEFQKNKNDSPSMTLLNRCKLAKDGKIIIENGLYKITQK